jgi:hypothetical protein
MFACRVVEEREISFVHLVWPIVNAFTATGKGVRVEGVDVNGAGTIEESTMGSDLGRWV